ncbi:MAG: hypothetical protein ACOCZ5_00205 [bacterium]
MPLDMPKNGTSFMGEAKASQFASSNNDDLANKFGTVFSGAFSELRQVLSKKESKNQNKPLSDMSKAMKASKDVQKQTLDIIKNQTKISETFSDQQKETIKILSKVSTYMNVVAKHYDKSVPAFTRDDEARRYKSSIISIPKILKETSEKERDAIIDKEEKVAKKRGGLLGKILGGLSTGIKTMAVGGVLGYILFGKGEYVTQVRKTISNVGKLVLTGLGEFIKDNWVSILKTVGLVAAIKHPIKSIKLLIATLKGLGKVAGLISGAKGAAGVGIGSKLAGLFGLGAKGTAVKAGLGAAAKGTLGFLGSAALPVGIGVGGGLLAQELLYRGLGGKEQERIKKEHEDATRREELKTKKIRDLMARRDRGEISQDEMVRSIRKLQNKEIGGDRPNVPIRTTSGAKAFGRIDYRKDKIEREMDKDPGVDYQDNLRKVSKTLIKNKFGGKLHRPYSKSKSIVKYLGFGTVPNLEGLNPDVYHNFLGMTKDFYSKTGSPVQVNSAYRPGLGGAHGAGFAIDIQSSHANAMEEMGLMQKWGFHRPLKKWASNYGGKKDEPWHIEPYPGSEVYGSPRNTMNWVPGKGQEWRMGVIAGNDTHIERRGELEVGGDAFTNLPQINIPERLKRDAPINVILSDKDIEKLSYNITQSFKNALPNNRMSETTMSPETSRSL